MAFPEAWPVATSRGDFTAAAAWFCFSFDCFSLVCATATSDKHANPNTRILLFILFSPMCGERTTLALSMRAPDKLSPFRLRDVGRLRRAPQVTEVLAGRVARAPSPAKIPSMQPRASPLVRFNKATIALGVEFDALIAAMQVYVDKYVAPIWGTPAKLVKTTGFKKGAWAMVFLDNADQPDALAYHDLTPDGLPQSKVFVKT